MKIKSQSLSQQTIKNSFWNFSSSLITRAGALLFTIILARFLSPEKFGIYNLVMSISFIFMIFFHSGINETFLRYFSNALGKQDKKKTLSYFHYLLKIKFIGSGIFSLALLFLAYPLAYYIFKKPILFFPLLLASFYIFVFSFEEFFSIIFFALKKVKYVAVKEIILQFSRILISLLVFLSIASAYYILGIIFGLIIASIFVLFFVLYHIRKFLPYLFKKNGKIGEKDKKRIIKFLIYIAIGSISFTFFGYIDILMLGLLIKDASFIGYYRSAFILVSSIGGLLTFSHVLLPIFVQIKKQRLQRAFNKVFRYSIILTIPATIGIILFSKYIIRAIYGYNYLPASILLYSLAPLIFLGCIVALFLNLFSALEKPRVYLPLLISIIIFNIFLNYILIIWLSSYSLIMGTTGAAIATITSWFFYACGLGILSKKRLNIKINLKTLFKPFFSSIIMAIMVFFVVSYVKEMTLIAGFLEIIFGALIYITIMLFIGGITKEDIFLFKELFKIPKFLEKINN